MSFGNAVTEEGPKVKNRIQMKIAMLVGVLMFLSAFAVGMAIHTGSNEIVFNQALKQLKYETNIKSLELLTDIAGVRKDVLYLAGTPPIQGIMRSVETGFDKAGASTREAWEQRLSIIFTELARAKPNYLQIRFISSDTKGTEQVRVDKMGTLVTPIPKRKLQEKGDTKYFREAVKLLPGQVYLSDITLNREHGKIVRPHLPVIRAATPVYKEGEVFGIIIVNMDFRGIFKHFITSTPEHLTPFVFNEEGFFLAHVDRKKTFGFDLQRSNKITDLYPNILKNLGSDLRYNTTSVFRDTSKGRHVINVVRASFDKGNDDRFLGVAIETSNTNLLAESNRLRNYSFVIMFAFLIIGILISIYVAYKITNPLKQVIEASKDIANGKDDIRLPTKSSDEIGDLAVAFNSMNDKLKENRKLLIQTQARSSQASKMASLGVLSSGIAHELNNPMATIKTRASTLRRMIGRNDLCSENADESLGVIESTIDRIGKIISGLRAFARDGKQDPFNIVTAKKIIDDTLQFCEEKIKSEGITLEVKYQAEGIEFPCRETQISQVLVNLLNNSRKAVEKLAEKWIKIAVTDSTESVMISVIDSGSGVSKEDLDRIMDPFFTTNDVGDGMGLGLSISKGIVEDHNGKFYIDRKSKNTKFVIDLPKVQPTAATKPIVRAA